MIESHPDHVLLEQIKNGNNSAFASLVKRHSTRYYHLAYRYVMNRANAEDIVQNAFLKLWEKPQIWNPKKGATFTTWFYRIIVNLSLDHLKKHKTISIPEDFDIADNGKSQEETLSRQEDKSALIKEVSKLPKRQKTAVILCVYEDLSHKQAATIMKINIKALQSLLMRAKATLKIRMEERA